MIGKVLGDRYEIIEEVGVGRICRNSSSNP